MIAAALGLAALLATCAPHVGAVTMRALVRYESGERPYAIGDNTSRRSYFPSRYTRAVTLANDLLAAGHSIDVGYAQINSSNFPPFGVDAAAALRPCTNVAIGATILRRWYRAARRVDGPGRTALIHALSAYNSGGYYAGIGYARGVYATGLAISASRSR